MSKTYLMCIEGYAYVNAESQKEAYQNAMEFFKNFSTEEMKIRLNILDEYESEENND